jgi:hypothetical protein
LISTSKLKLNQRFLNEIDQESQNPETKGTTHQGSRDDNSFDLMNKSIWNFEKKDDLTDFKQKFNILKENDNRGLTKQNQPTLPENTKMVSI